jgi:hypothetical protein
MKGSDVSARARFVVQDHAAVRWDDAEMALWINDACRFIVINRPDACPVNASMSLVAGIKQSIAGLTPPGLRVLDTSLRLVDREVLDAHRPGWRSEANGVPKNYVFDSRDPKTFYVYPGATAAAPMDVLYSRVPVEVTADTLGSTVLSIDDIFSDVALNYVLFRCYAKDSAETINANLAQMYLNAAMAGLGIKSKADLAYSPDTNSPGAKVPAGAMMGA